MTYQFEGIDHIQLAAPANCEEQARKFFGEILGMQELEKPPELKKRGGVWFSCGNHQLHIGVENNFHPAKKAHPALVVKDIKHLMNHLTDQNVPYQEDDNLPNARRLYMEDPFGNRIEILEWQS
ncbi:glyoxalase [Thalassobacillus devorans]|uniref:Glyoxalase n=1 Tax=Thalassobacillus devorans TaxID=279813 RepID=A0ABQ1NSW4_9BACI|nr:VOC family protein [Thalassobacillus devorans]NIK29006.1 catechol 2,3-dioxygenase-like lactoylglutathione lyase family enzyme [Thalassobacillus devorans]GGC81893.1 glyoxalase [Thalassobacillus devorans]